MTNDFYVSLAVLMSFWWTIFVSSRESLGNHVHLFRYLWIFETILCFNLGRFRWFQKRRPSIPVISSVAVFSDEANQIFKTKRCPSTQECIHEGLSQFCWDLPICQLSVLPDIYSQSTSRVTWRSETEMNIRNPLCNFQHSNGMLKFSRKIALTFAN